MQRHKSFLVEYFNIILVCLVMLLMPIKQGWLSLVLAGFIGNGIFSFFTQKTFFHFAKPPFFYWSLLYGLLYIIGFIGSENQQQAQFDIIQKSSIAILLFLMAIPNMENHGKNMMIWAQRIFVISNGLTLILCLIMSAYNYFAFNDINAFYYVNLSHFMHTGYFSMYLCFCVAILLNDLRNGSVIFIRPFISFIVMIFITLGIYLLAAKTSMIVVLLIFLIFIIDFIHRKVKSRVNRNILALLIVIILAAIPFLPATSNRLNTIIKDLSTYDTKGDEIVDTAGQRIFVWQSALSVIQNNFWFGTGTGDDNDILHQEFKNRDFEFLLDKKLNAHNQYLQTFITFGVFGFLFFVGYTLFPLFWGWKNKDFLLISFALIIIINSMTESIFNRQAGIIFWTVWVFLLLYHHGKNNKINYSGHAGK